MIFKISKIKHTNEFWTKKLQKIENYRQFINFFHKR